MVDTVREIATRPAHVFVVGSGRSGTTTIASTISAVPGCVIEHEREPMLLEEVVDRLNGRLSKAQMVEILRMSRGVDAIGGDVISGEANQRLSFVIPELAEAFPTCRVIGLVRDGRAAVASMRYRGMYGRQTGDPTYMRWVGTRITGPMVGAISARAWARMTPFERCCWYWGYTYGRIALDERWLDERLLWLRLEDLDARRDELASFLGLPSGSIVSPPRSNASRHGKPLHWTMWSRWQRHAFERWCGPQMDRHYPTWREAWEAAYPFAPRPVLVRACRAAQSTLADKTRPLRIALGMKRRSAGA